MASPLARTAAALQSGALKIVHAGPAGSASRLHNSCHSTFARPFPRTVKVFEVGPRDGLQAETTQVPTAAKIRLVDDLTAAGHRHIEVTSFVSPKAIPQLSDSNEVLAGIKRKEGVTYSALVPNTKGMESAISAGLKEIAVFGAASDAFSLKNIACNVMTSLERFRPVMAMAKQHDIRVRGYVSCVLGCPYSGFIHPDAVAFVARTLLDMGCYEVSLGDTIGVGTPLGVHALVSSMREHGIPTESLAVHFHATYGLALANVVAALEEGVRVIDSSVAGLGGCPYAKGASGNVPTEDVLYLLQGLGIEVEGNPSLEATTATGHWICDSILGKPNRSFVAQARLAHEKALSKAEATLTAPDAAEADKVKAKQAAEYARIGLRWPWVPPDSLQPATAAAPAAPPEAPKEVTEPPLVSSCPSEPESVPTAGAVAELRA